jgi:acyl-CoA dehydrogenase
MIAVLLLMVLTGVAFAFTQSGWLITVLFVIAVLTLAYQRLSLWVFSLTFTVLLGGYTVIGHPTGVWKGGLWLLLAALWLLNVLPLRRALISGPFMAAYRKLLPSMSATEREALRAVVDWLVTETAKS